MGGPARQNAAHLAAGYYCRGQPPRRSIFWSISVIRRMVTARAAMVRR